MGVDLKPLVSAGSIKIPELADKVIAVDAYNTIYQFLATIRGPTGDLLTNSRGEITSHLSGLFYRNINLLSDNLKLVYIFDGKPSLLKTQEIERRRQVKKEAFEKYQLAIEEGRMQDARKYSQATSAITSNMVEESKKMLKILGIPYIMAPSEGEATAAYLTKNNIAFACASQDYDSILFGAEKLVRNLTISGKRKIPNRNVYVDIEPEIIDYDKLMEQLKITHEQLIDVAILIGTDFNPGGFSGIGPKTAIKLVQENGRLENIERIQEKLSSLPYQQIRDIFLKPEIVKIENLDFKDPDYDAVVDFLCIEKNFSAERVTSSLNKLKKSISNRSQSLEKWFT